MSHTHAVTDSDPNFVVDGSTRKIETSATSNLVQYDHNSQRITFQVPRYIDGHDMSKCNVVQVHYQNISANKKKQNNGIYEVDDLAISMADADLLTCSWLVSQNATQYGGTLNFVVRFACVENEATQYAWNTSVYTGLVVSNGINNTDIVIQEYPDILSDHESRLKDLEGNATTPAATGNTVKSGLTVAIIGDSISTHPQKNVSEIVVEAADVGVELSSYISYYDIDKTISLDGETSGYTITSDDVGTELTFKPCTADIGKTLGTPLNYNSIKNVWWQVAADALGFDPIAACWSGSSITAHTSSTASKTASYAWHDHTIRTLGIRVPGSMNRIPPDVVLIYRGTNDLSHTTKVRLTDGYFDTVAWTYPETDLLSDGATYGYKEGLALTIQKIRTTYPNARIVLCTCNVFKRSNYATFPTHNGYFSIPQMNTAIREVADFFGCQTIDLDRCGITWENCYDSGYITDSSTTPTHPNATGHYLMGLQAINDLVTKLHICDIDPANPVTDDEDDTSGSGTTDSTDITSYIVEGTAINGSTGASFSGEAYFSLMSYPVEAGETYAFPYGRNYGVFDSSDTVLATGFGGGAVGLQITMPANAAWIDICYKYDDLDPADVTVTKVSDNSSDSSTDDTESESTDLSAYIQEGIAVDASTGLTFSGSAYFSVIGFPVTGDVSYAIPYGRNYGFFDSSGTMLSGGQGGGKSALTITAPTNSATLNICFKYDDLAVADVTITAT